MKFVKRVLIMLVILMVVSLLNSNVLLANKKDSRTSHDNHEVGGSSETSTGATGGRQFDPGTSGKTPSTSGSNGGTTPSTSGSSSGISINGLESDANKFITTGKKGAGTLSGVTNSITKNFSGIGSILTMVGAGVMVAVVTYMGIKYIISPPDKQAALKQQLIGVVAAGIVIFGAYGIWSAILRLVSNFD